VDLSPHFLEIRALLESLTGKYAQRLAGMGFPPPLRHKAQFMALRQRILNIPHNIKYPALVQYSVLLHTLHMTELLETQGIYPVRAYLEKLEGKESKSAGLLLHEPALAKVKELCQKDEDHPKMAVLVGMLKKLAGKKIIVFVQYRSQISRIETVLNAGGISAKQFVGKREGMTRKLQEQTIADFREGKFDVLVASSIGEEGLDIPAVDAVIFYEPVPSEIRSIQRRGRAARLKEGEIIVLMTKGTRDEYYYYASGNREKRMKSILKGMSRAKKPGPGTLQPAPGIKLPTPAQAPAAEPKMPESRKRKKREGQKLSGQTKMSDFA
jgi:Fanconi anemia group M protein